MRVHSALTVLILLISFNTTQADILRTSYQAGLAEADLNARLDAWAAVRRA